MRRHLTYANVAATLALVFAMTGGALAAKHYLINSTSQINPKVLRKLRGAKGRTGTTGPQGRQGLQGAAGTPGGTGAQGPTGPSNAYTAVNTSFVGTKFPEDVALVSVTVPAGSYVVSAKVQAFNETKERQRASCELVVNGNEEDSSSATLEPIGTTSYDGQAAITLLEAVTLAAPGTVRVDCGTSNASEKMKLTEAQLTAVQVGSLSRVGS